MRVDSMEDSMVDLWVDEKDVVWAAHLVVSRVGSLAEMVYLLAASTAVLMAGVKVLKSVVVTVWMMAALTVSLRVATMVAMMADPLVVVSVVQ